MLFEYDVVFSGLPKKNIPKSQMVALWILSADSKFFCYFSLDDWFCGQFKQNLEQFKGEIKRQYAVKMGKYQSNLLNSYMRGAALSYETKYSMSKEIALECVIEKIAVMLCMEHK